MKRYDIVEIADGPIMVEATEGAWVRYSDIGKPDECICPDIDKCETAMGCLKLAGYVLIVGGE